MGGKREYDLARPRYSNERFKDRLNKGEKVKPPSFVQLKCASVMWMGGIISLVGVVDPEWGKLGVMGVPNPD